VACKSDQSNKIVNKVEANKKVNVATPKVVTVSQSERANDVANKGNKASVAEKNSIESDTKNGEKEMTADELVQKAIDTKPIARVTKKTVSKTTKPAPKKKKKSRPAKKPDPVRSAPKEYAPKLEFDEKIFDFGEITEGDIIKHNFTFTNNGKSNLSIEKATASCGCTKPSFPFIDIKPGETGYIGVTYNSVSKDGPQKPTITVFSNAEPKTMTLFLEGIVKPKPKEEIKEEEEPMAQDTTKN